MRRPKLSTRKFSAWKKKKTGSGVIYRPKFLENNSGSKMFSVVVGFEMDHPVYSKLHDAKYLQVFEVLKAAKHSIL